MNEEQEPELPPLQFTDYPADPFWGLQDDIPLNYDLSAGTSSSSLNHLPVNSIPHWRIVGVLLVEADRHDVHNTYKVEVIREMTMPGIPLKLGFGEHDVLGYLCGLESLEVNGAPEDFGNELVVPFYSPKDLSIAVTALSLDTATNGLRKVGVLDIPTFSAPLYLTRSFPPGSLPGSLRQDPGNPNAHVYLLKDDSVLLNFVLWSLKYSPPFLTVSVQQVPLPYVSPVREGKKRARARSSPKTLESRKLLRLEDALPPDLYDGHQELPHGWLDIHSISKAAFDIGVLIAGTDQTSPQESQQFPSHLWDFQDQESSVGGEAGSSGGYQGQTSGGLGGEGHDLDASDGFLDQEAGEEVGREVLQDQQGEYGPSVSDGHQGQETDNEAGGEVVPTTLKWVNGDWVAKNWYALHEPGDIIPSDSDSDEYEDEGDYVSLDDELLAARLMPSIYSRDLSVITTANMPGLMTIYYRRLTVELNDASTLIGTIETIAAISKTILTWLIRDLHFEDRAYSPATLTTLINRGTKKIRDFIKVMKSYARTIVWGETDRGGYGLDKTPEGALRARALIHDNSFLYRGGAAHSSSDAKYGHPGLRLGGQKIAYAKVGPDLHPFNESKDNLAVFYAKPELRTERPDTSCIIAIGLILEQIYIAAGDKEGGRAIIESPAWWQATTADYFRHVARVEPLKGIWAQTIPLEERCIKKTNKPANTSKGNKD